MNRRMKVRGVALGLLLGLAAVGCAQERDPIDRVQPNVLKKSFFLGENIHDSSDDPEFFMRAYSVGSSYDQPAFWYGTGSGVDRVRFEVTENLLIVRKAYQVGRGRDDKGVPGGDPNGTVVAAYRIESHFDIRKSYNPATGEELNITEENGSDRPWYEREYFRVDWSTNEVANPMYLDDLFSKWFGDPKITPMRYQVTDPNSEDAPFLDEKEGYLEITNRIFVEPGQMYFSWGSLPSCVVYGMISGTNINDCNMQAANLRLTYWKIDPNRDFEPFINTQAAEDVVNNFATAGWSVTVQWGAPISDYDPAYGFTDKGYHIPMHAINLWEKSHVDIACTSTDDLNNDGTADQCEVYQGAKGSRCDTFFSWRPHEIKGAVAAAQRDNQTPERIQEIKDYLSKAGRCTIPYRDRKVKTLGWWVNKEMPVEYQDTLDANGNPMDKGAVEDVVHSWDQMFTSAVAMARSAECRRTGDGDRDQCHNTYFRPEKRMVSYGGWLIDWPQDETKVFTLCHNPVRSYDDPTCGKAGDTARTGDLRKFFLIDWPWATNSPFGGVTDLHSDPTTGEAIGNTSLTVHVESRASRILDTLLVAMGDLSLEEYMSGASNGRYAKVMSGPLPTEPLSQEEIQKRIDAINTHNLAQSGVPAPSGISNDKVEVAKAAIRAKLELKADQDMRKMQALRNDQLIAPLRNTTLEHDLMDAAWLKAAKLDPTAQLTDSVMDLASPLRGMDASKMQLLRQEMEQRFARAGACFSEMQQTAQMGQVINAPLANYFLQKYGSLSREERIAEMRKELRVESFKGVMLHEMGHALGMRHQFSSSWDAPNYMPQYWQLRTADGTATQSCGGQARDPNQPDSCMGPRYLDPHTLDEQGYGNEPRPGIEYFAGTSTMEYQSERFSETAGLGTWDYHMTKAIYGRVLETYDNNVMPRDGGTVADQRRLATRMFTHLADVDYVYDSVTFDDGSQPFGPEPFMHSWHYTKVNRAMNIFDPARDCRPATDEEKAKAKWRIVHGKICQPYPRDYASWYDFRSDYNAEAEEPMMMWHTRPDLKGGNADTVRWSYRIGEHYEPTYVHTNMIDAGADSYEVTVNEIRNFNANYPSVYFRRHRRGSPPSWGAAGYAMDLFERLRSYHWSIANTNLRWLSFGQTYYTLFSGDDNWSRPDVMANTEIFNALAAYVLSPQPGDYRPRAGDPSGVYDAVDWVDPGADFVVQTIDGRFVDDAYDAGPNAGGSWAFQDYETRAGFYAEKAYAFLALCDSRPTLSTIAREVYLDDRGVKLNFRSDMPEAFDRLFGGMLAEDWQSIGMWVPGDAQQGQPAVPAMFDLMKKSEPTRPAGAKVLYPNLGYMQQLYAAIFSALYARENTDMTLIHKMRIWIDGVEANISDVAFPEQETQVRFYHPGSGFTYIARSFGTENIDGRTVDRGISSRMLQRANQLVALSYVVEKDAQGKPVLDAYGRPTLVLDAQGQPQPLDAYDSKMGELTRYVGLIDAVRQLGHILGQGPY